MLHFERDGDGAHRNTLTEDTHKKEQGEGDGKVSGESASLTPPSTNDEHQDEAIVSGLRTRPCAMSDTTTRENKL